MPVIQRIGWLLGGIFLLSLSSCNQYDAAFQDAFSYSVEEAHNAEVWEKQSAIQSDFVLLEGDSSYIAQLTFTPLGDKIKIRTRDGIIGLYDGRDLYVFPDSLPLPEPAQRLVRLSFLLVAPYTLNQPGIRLINKGNRKLGEREFTTATLSYENKPLLFSDGLIYFRDENDRIAIISNFSISPEKENKTKQAVVFEETAYFYKVPVPIEWRFCTWDPETGIKQDTLMRIRLENFDFTETDPYTFAIPDGAEKKEINVAIQ